MELQYIRQHWSAPHTGLLDMRHKLGSLPHRLRHRLLSFLAITSIAKAWHFIASLGQLCRRALACDKEMFPERLDLATGTRTAEFPQKHCLPRPEPSEEASSWSKDLSTSVPWMNNLQRAHLSQATILKHGRIAALRPG